MSIVHVGSSTVIRPVTPGTVALANRDWQARVTAAEARAYTQIRLQRMIVRFAAAIADLDPGVPWSAQQIGWVQEATRRLGGVVARLGRG